MSDLRILLSLACILLGIAEFSYPVALIVLGLFFMIVEFARIAARSKGDSK